jgi:hypothetical protein
MDKLTLSDSIFSSTSLKELVEAACAGRVITLVIGFLIKLTKVEWTTVLSLSQYILKPESQFVCPILKVTLLTLGSLIHMMFVAASVCQKNSANAFRMSVALIRS